MDGPVEERQLVNDLEDAGYGAIRLAASGGGSQSDLPDILCCVNGQYVAAEMKARGGDTDLAYITEPELESLYSFCQRWNAIPLAINRWSEDTQYYAIPLRNAKSDMFTKSGNLRMRRGDVDSYHEMMRYISIVGNSTDY